MIHVYIMSVEALEREALFSGAFQKVDALRQEKVKKAVRQADRLRSLGAGLLLQYAAACYGGGPYGSFGKEKVPVGGAPSPSLDQEQAAFHSAEFLTVYEAVRQPFPFRYRFGQEGKPYLAGEDMPFYSLSHSGSYVLCAIGDREVGADIQAYREEKNDRLARRYFTGPEAECMEAAGPKEQKELFYRFWTAKEAYVKLTGKGLKQGLNSFRADLEKGRILEQDAPKGSLAEYRELPGYAVSVCFYGEFT